MQTKTIEGVKYLFVQVPEDGFDFRFAKSIIYEGEEVLVCKTPFRWNEYKKEYWIWEMKAPIGKWQIVGKASLLQESDWSKIVKVWIPGAYNDYNDQLGYYDNANELGLSLLVSMNLELETTLILKEI